MRWASDASRKCFGLPSSTAGWPTRVIWMAAKSSSFNNLVHSRLECSPTACTSTRVPRTFAVSTRTGSVQCGPARTTPSANSPARFSTFMAAPPCGATR
jgi:hypothetical protein